MELPIIIKKNLSYKIFNLPDYVKFGWITVKLVNMPLTLLDDFLVIFIYNNNYFKHYYSKLYFFKNKIA